MSDKQPVNDSGRLERYGMSPIPSAGSDSGLYEHNVLFDSVRPASSDRVAAKREIWGGKLCPVL
ncbi:MAG TPA: hypothetical protein VGG72_36570 [Bryobacteraceae bacterium]|jgi:hypothetical protein